ncbi:unnamed protein product [Pleuronectes platessa]|uniref:Uncharacterized protein n=1 Tax=Pleuronectes platessa TaxID=8262 RepID=A0A9N7Z1C5_PLEPL|nr:unnamed protein product [Pleuronectes platessa]
MKYLSRYVFGNRSNRIRNQMKVRGPVHDAVWSFNHHFVRVDILTHLFGRRGRGRALQVTYKVTQALSL